MPRSRSRPKFFFRRYSYPFEQEARTSTSRLDLVSPIYTDYSSRCTFAGLDAFRLIRERSYCHSRPLSSESRPGEWRTYLIGNWSFNKAVSRRSRTLCMHEPGKHPRVRNYSNIDGLRCPGTPFRLIARSQWLTGCIASDLARRRVFSNC